MNEYEVTVTSVVVVRAKDINGARTAAIRAVETGNTDARTTDVEGPISSFRVVGVKL